MTDAPVSRSKSKLPVPPALGVRLVDCPGLHDDNSARDQTIRKVSARPVFEYPSWRLEICRCGRQNARTLTQVVGEAHALMVCSNVRRACNDKGAYGLLPLKLRRELLSNAHAGAVAFVATQGDVLTKSEIVENLSLPDDSTVLQCALARNAFIKKQARCSRDTREMQPRYAP